MRVSAILISVGCGVAAMLIYDAIKKRQAAAATPGTAGVGTIQITPPSLTQWPKLGMDQIAVPTVMPGSQLITV